MSVQSLHEAAASGDMGIMNKFLDVDDLEIDQKNADGKTALMCAAIAGEAAAGGLLVECDADINAMDEDGNTALHHTGIHGKRLVTSMLLWGGADRGLKNKLGNTALHEAVVRGNKDVAWLICENGGDHTAKFKNAEDKTPLDLAREGGHTECIELLEPLSATKPSGGEGGEATEADKSLFEGVGFSAS